MILTSILILIVAIALPSINSNILSLLYIRISSIIFIYAGVLSFNALYIQSIGSGIGVYNNLFQVTLISQLFDIFIVLIGSLILVYYSLMNNNTSNLVEVDSTITLDTNVISINNYPREYSLIVLMFTLGASILISSLDLNSLYLNIELQSFGVNTLFSFSQFLNFNIGNIKITLLTLIKILFIFIFIIIFFYIIYIEKNKPIININRDLKLAGFGSNKVGEAFVAFSAGVGLLSGAITIGDKIKASIALRKAEAEYKAEIIQLQDEIKKLTETVISNISNILKQIEKYNSLVRETESNLDSLVPWLTRLEEINDYLVKNPNSEKASSLNLEYSLISSHVTDIKSKLSQSNTEIRSLEISEVPSNLEGKNDPDSSTWIKSPLEKEIFLEFSLIKNIFISLFLLDSVIFSCIISIIAALFSEYLINRFSLKLKYPKIAKFLDIRHKFQSYYIKLNLAIILLILSLKIFFYLYICLL